MLPALETVRFCSQLLVCKAASASFDDLLPTHMCCMLSTQATGRLEDCANEASDRNKQTCGIAAECAADTHANQPSEQQAPASNNVDPCAMHCMQ